jgi:cellulose synthase/poly-beta-1,6-N-acetylglucosamine synthase-like glycosyltransferase
MNKNLKQNSDTGKHKIRFHILIAAYNASDSIVPVLNSIGEQDYPSELVNAWVITEKTEQEVKNNQLNEMVNKISNCNTDFDENMISLLWKCSSSDCKYLNEWIEEIRGGGLRGFLKYQKAHTVFLEELLSYLCDVEYVNSINENNNLSLILTNDEIIHIERIVGKINKQSITVRDDFTRILGTHKIYGINDIKRQLIKKVINDRSLHKIANSVFKRLHDESILINNPDSNSINLVAKSHLFSTQEVVKKTIVENGYKNITNLDPHNRGFKPGALNIAYEYINDKGYFKNTVNTYFLIIDSDSLLPTNALKVIAEEIESGNGRDILQLVSTPTANYFCSGWFSRFVAVADALGAVGKWARSTRRQLKPDLHAGSGVVIPSALAKYISYHEGKPWSEATLTEDARLIVGQFGMMHGASNMTKLAPVVLLEAVPSEINFQATYKSFWNQRRRWTLGGYDEFFYILASHGWLLNSFYNQENNQWEKYIPGAWEKLRIRVKQYTRLSLWLWDHFIWGIGGFIALTHWWLISLFIIEPGKVISLLGLVLVLLTPLLILYTSTKKVLPYVPGGVSVRDKIILYFISFFVIWLYCLPVVATQVACLFGFRPVFVDWKPTKKPLYAAINP